MTATTQTPREATSKGPARRPCGSCPYRTDAPSGLWHEDEYAKLPRYDEPTFAQPAAVFLCHQQDSRLCAGWCGTHDIGENLALRIAAVDGTLSGEDLEAALTYTSPVPLFPTGQAAADHGLRDIDAPDARSRRTAAKLTTRHGLR